MAQPAKTKVSGRFDLNSDQRFLVAALLIVQTLDVISTAVGLRLGLVEGNVLAAAFMARYGELAAYGMKALLTFVILATVLLLSGRFQRLWVGMRIIYLYMSAVVAFNILGILTVS